MPVIPSVLTQVAAGVWVRESEFVQSNAIVVQGREGVLLVDPGISADDLAELADDIAALGQPVVAGFATHPDWDHVLWHPRFGDAPRYGTARCAAAIREQLDQPGAKERIADHLVDTEVEGNVPMDLLGEITALPAGTVQLPWDGPIVRILEHQAHAPGHAALLLEEQRVLLAGDMLSDVLVPMLDLEAADPIEDYLTALHLLDDVAGEVDIVVPGHGSVGVDQVRARIDLDRAYVLALREPDDRADPRVGPSAKEGWEWVSYVHEPQVRHFAGPGLTREGAP